MDTLYSELKYKAHRLWAKDGLVNEQIIITARALSTTEAIGNPSDNDYPIQKGKEKLMQAEFKGAYGQAFTDMSGNYEGTLKDILELPMKDSYEISAFIASLNAVLCFQKRTDQTIHCKDDEPVDCAEKLKSHIQSVYGNVKITQIGFQPRMAGRLSKSFPLRLVDLDPDNIGKKKQGVMIEGPETSEDAIDWCDLLLVTGSTIANGSIVNFLGRKKVLFYGTSIAGAATLMGWDRFCPKGT